MRRRRKRLNKLGQLNAEKNLAIVARHYYPLRKATRILSYAPFAGEISPNKLIANLTRAKIYQPRITNYRLGQMQCYPQTSSNERNSLGIHEPTITTQPTPTQYFDVVLVPLVAFDRTGNRLGMGAGFYDRALSFKLNNPSLQRPLLVGLAHQFQEVKSLAAQSWDVPLDAILTDQKLYLTRTSIAANAYNSANNSCNNSANNKIDKT